MKIYRVYASYHQPSESGTKEYGYFSDEAVAVARAIDMAKCDYPFAVRHKVKIQQHGRSIEATCQGYEGDATWVNVDEIEVDQMIDRQMVGYT